MTDSTPDFHMAGRPRAGVLFTAGLDPLVLSTVLDVDTYDVTLVEVSDRAYSQIKRAAPQVVIACLEADDAEGLHVLSMLGLDSATSHIPVLDRFVAPDAGDLIDGFELDRRAVLEPMLESMH